MNTENHEYKCRLVFGFSGKDCILQSEKQEYMRIEYYGLTDKVASHNLKK